MPTVRLCRWCIDPVISYATYLGGTGLPAPGYGPCCGLIGKSSTLPVRTRGFVDFPVLAPEQASGAPEESMFPRQTQRGGETPWSLPPTSAGAAPITSRGNCGGRFCAEHTSLVRPHIRQFPRWFRRFVPRAGRRRDAFALQLERGGQRRWDHSTYLGGSQLGLGDRDRSRCLRQRLYRGRHALGRFPGFGRGPAGTGWGDRRVRDQTYANRSDLVQHAFLRRRVGRACRRNRRGFERKPLPRGRNDLDELSRGRIHPGGERGRSGCVPREA